MRSRIAPSELEHSRNDSAAKNLLLHKGCINIQSERWRSMDATPGEGEQAKGGERQDVARALSPMDGRLARYPLSRETSRRCCPCEDCERYIYASQ